MGSETLAVIEAYRKLHTSLVNEGDIRSVFHLRQAPGRVYFEASKASAVHVLSKNIIDLYATHTILIPRGEQVQLLNCNGGPEMKEGSWVRITRRGLYKRDIAQVLNVSRNGETVTVRVVPRVRRSAKKKPETKRARTNNATCVKAQRFRMFDARRILNANNIRATEKGFKILDREIVEDPGEEFEEFGFLIKTLSHHEVEWCKPTMDDIQQFIDASAEKMANEVIVNANASDADVFRAGNINIDNISIPSLLRKGNIVRGTKGDIEGIEAKVLEGHNDNTVRVELNDLHRTRVDWNTSEVARVFDIGEAVEVKLGVCAGRQGIVVKQIGDEVEMQEEKTENQVSKINK